MARTQDNLLPRQCSYLELDAWDSLRYCLLGETVHKKVDFHGQGEAELNSAIDLDLELRTGVQPWETKSLPYFAGTPEASKGCDPASLAFAREPSSKRELQDLTWDLPGPLNFGQPMVGTHHCGNSLCISALKKCDS